MKSSTNEWSWRANPINIGGKRPCRRRTIDFSYRNHSASNTVRNFMASTSPLMSTTTPHTFPDVFGPAPRASSAPTRRQHLSALDRRAIFEQLLELSHNGSLPRGAIVHAAKHWRRDRATITRIWARGLRSRRDGATAADVSSKMRGMRLHSF